MKDNLKKIILHPLTIAIVVFLIVHIFNITRFDFLPEKDSYGWLAKYINDLRYNSVNDYRQLFSTLIISLHHVTGLSLFNVFKYLVPLFFLTTFIPLWLVARNLKHYSSQLMILLSALGSATVILQMDATRPQVIALLFLYFSLGLAVISRKEKNKDFVVVFLGSIILVGALFHRVFVIFLLLWIISVLFQYRKILLRNKTKVLVLFFLAIPWLEKFEVKNMILNALESSREIFNQIFIHLQLNFCFPTIYTNNDNHQMGWDGLTGVAKYYAFYAGPFWLFLISLILVFLAFSKKFRNYAKENFKKKEFLFVFLLLVFFLFIAEILPRIGNIAYLPDRAWVFLGVLLILPLYFVFDFLENNFSKKTRLKLFFVLLFLLFVSIAGGAYINNAMKNIIPEYKMESYNWIKKNIDPNSLLFSFGYTRALKYHSGMNVARIDKNVLKNRDLSKLIYILGLEDKNNFDKSLYKRSLKTLIRSTDLINDTLRNKYFSYDQLTAQTKNTQGIASVLFAQVASSINTDINNMEVYIYIAKDSENNPYRERVGSTGGYYSDLNQNDIKILHDHPEYFTKVYDTGDVMLWKFLNTN